MDFIPSTLAFIGDLAGPEMIFVVIIALMLFGKERLPGFARGLGKSIREFKKAAAGVEDELKRAMEEDEQKSITPAIYTPPTPALPEPSAAEQPALLPPATTNPEEFPDGNAEETPAATPTSLPPEPPTVVSTETPIAPEAAKPTPPPTVTPGDHLP